MFMARGEYQPVYEPTDDELEAAIDAIAAPGFVPAYVHTKHGAARFLHLYAHFTLRWLAFEFLMRWQRNPLGWRYLMTRYPICGNRVRLRDWQTMSCADPNWRAIFDGIPERRRVFLGLQATPEASVDYWVKPLDLIQHEAFFVRAAEALSAAGYRVFIKDHPSQFGFRRIEHLRRLIAIPDVVMVPSEIPARALIDHCHATVTLTGTVGFQAAVAGRGAAVAVDAYYSSPGNFIELGSLRDLDRLATAFDELERPADLRDTQRCIVRHLLRASVPGALHWVKWKPGSEPRRPVAPLIQSLNRYMPLFLPGGSLGLRT
jgi:hypothetical protein